jgi:hypothetical protein
MYRPSKYTVSNIGWFIIYFISLFDIYQNIYLDHQNNISLSSYFTISTHLTAASTWLPILYRCRSHRGHRNGVLLLLLRESLQRLLQGLDLLLLPGDHKELTQSIGVASHGLN